MPEPSTHTYVLTSSDEAAIRVAAANVLDQGFRSLTRARILPRSRYRPWIWMARDYFGDDVRDNGQLAAALDAALPARFERQHLDATDYPWSYSYALIEAAVAAATLAEEPYETSSSSVQGVVDEFIDKMRRTPRSTVLQVVADVGVKLVEESRGRLGDAIEIAGVRIISVENEPERFIERELPSAGYEVHRSEVFVHPGPVSLLVATRESTGASSTRVAHARRSVGNLLAAVRLATGTTARAVADISGDPDRVRWESPSITPLPSWGFRFVHRPVTLSVSEAKGISVLVTMIGLWTDQEEWTPVRLALGRLGRSLDGRAPGFDDQVVDLSIGLEAALGGTDTTEVGLRLRTRAAALLTTDGDAADVIFRDVKRLYDIRSRFVHGGVLSEKAARAAITGVARADTRSPAEQYLIALDRWRDLLRRAILTRVALTTAPVPWTTAPKSTRPFDVDEFLVVERNRKVWVDHVREFWSDRGLALAPERAADPRLWLERATDAKSDSTTAGRE